MRNPVKLICFLSLLLSPTIFAQEKTNCEEAFDQMYRQWGSIRTMQYHSEKFERHLDEENHAEFDFTIQREPFKVAGRMTEKGHYILYDPETSPDEALYISNGFPYTNLMLNIHGSVFRGLNHYTISDAGCEFIYEIIRREYQRIPENFTCQNVVRKGNEEILIRAVTENFHWRPYTAKPGETVLEIAHQNSVSAYLIIEYNDNISDYNVDCDGKQIKIPSHYGKIVELYVDAEHGMPTRIANYDEQGLFESYEYTNYEFNMKLDPEFFTEDFLDDLN